MKYEIIPGYTPPPPPATPTTITLTVSMEELLVLQACVGCAPMERLSQLLDRPEEVHPLYRALAKIVREMERRL